MHKVSEGWNNLLLSCKPSNSRELSSSCFDWHLDPDGRVDPDRLSPASPRVSLRGLEAIKWRNLEKPGLCTLQPEKLQTARCFNHRSHTPHHTPASSHFQAENSAPRPARQSGDMAGDGSDQRALQYEQTLVSFTCCSYELCSLVNTARTVLMLGEGETRLHWQICQFNAARLAGWTRTSGTS